MLKNIINGVQNSGAGQQLFSMRFPHGLRLCKSLQIANDDGLLGNVVDASGKITQRARFEAVQGGVEKIAQINPAIMLME